MMKCTCVSRFCLFAFPCQAEEKYIVLECMCVTSLFPAQVLPPSPSVLCQREQRFIILLILNYSFIINREVLILTLPILPGLQGCFPDTSLGMD